MTKTCLGSENERLDTQEHPARDQSSRAWHSGICSCVRWRQQHRGAVRTLKRSDAQQLDADSTDQHTMGAHRSSFSTVRCVALPAPGAPRCFGSGYSYSLVSVCAECAVALGIALRYLLSCFWRRQQHHFQAPVGCSGDVKQQRTQTNPRKRAQCGYYCGGRASVRPFTLHPSVTRCATNAMLYAQLHQSSIMPYA